MPLAGIQLSSLRPYLQTERDARDTFSRLSAMGCRVVQLQWLSPSLSPEWVAGALRATGLKSVSSQDFFEQVQKDWEQTVRLNRLCGSRHICVSGIPGHFLDADACSRFALRAGRMARSLAPLGMRLSFHPRAREYAKIGDKTAVELVLEQTPELMLGLDCYHAVKAGAEPAALIRRYASRIDFVHFKDFYTDPRGTEHLVPLGRGRIDWPPLIAACREAQIPWIFAEQETWETDAFACMAESLAYLAGHGVDLC